MLEKVACYAGAVEPVCTDQESVFITVEHAPCLCCVDGRDVADGLEEGLYD